VNIQSTKMHEQYNVGSASYANDIAILTFSSPVAIGGNVQVATLPANNNNDYAGASCTITGWGRTSASNTLPNILQEAQVPVLSVSACQTEASGANIWANHICILDPSGTSSACNGDSGGPLNCPSGGSFVVSGIASFVFAAAGVCMPARPSVYTRTSTYLAWIAANTP
jgi:secreted trypsin-like serine protease